VAPVASNNVSRHDGISMSKLDKMSNDDFVSTINWVFFRISRFIFHMDDEDTYEKAREWVADNFVRSIAVGAKGCGTDEFTSKYKEAHDRHLNPMQFRTLMNVMGFSLWIDVCDNEWWESSAKKVPAISVVSDQWDQEATQRESTTNSDEAKCEDLQEAPAISVAEAFQLVRQFAFKFGGVPTENIPVSEWFYLSDPTRRKSTIDPPGIGLAEGFRLAKQVPERTHRIDGAEDAAVSEPIEAFQLAGKDMTAEDIPAVDVSECFYLSDQERPNDAEYNRLLRCVYDLDNAVDCPGEFECVSTHAESRSFSQKLLVHVRDMRVETDTETRIVNVGYLLDNVLNEEQLRSVCVSLDARVVWFDQSVTLYGVKVTKQQMWRAIDCHILMRSYLVKELKKISATWFK
jgi:hypothetical protein